MILFTSMLFFQIYLAFLTASCLVGWLRWNRMDPPLHWLVVLVHFTWFIESSAFYLIYQLKQSAIFLYHFSSPVYVGLWLIYFVRRGFSLRWATVIGIVFLIFHGLTSYNVTLEVTNSSSNALRAVTLIFLGIWSIQSIFERLEEEDLLKNPHFWVSIGLTVFYSGTFIYLGLQSKFMEEKMHLAKWLHYYLLFSLNLVFYTSLLVSFLCPRKT